MAAPAPARMPAVEAPRPQIQRTARPSLPEPRPVVRSSRWLKVVLAATALLLAVDYGTSGILGTGWLNARFTRRLEAAFGRPVEVSNYSFSLYEGPRLEANYITVGEDPRFGSEYFLRADQLAVGLRWSALLHGRIELGTLSFTNPHLNLMHLPDGEWNLESWLPHPPGNVTGAELVSRGFARPQRIEISGGRVDFKNGNNKLPFALMNVEGLVEEAAPGSWQLDLKAEPYRAAVALQQAGELRLTGEAGGTASRLRPANLLLDWSNASLPDVLRLARGTDYGVRGLLALQVSAQTEGAGWRYASHAQLSQLHRWNLPPRTEDPAVNLAVDAHWVPGNGRLELTQALIETPDSSVRATGNVRWKYDARSSRLAVKDTQFELTSPGIQLGDLLTWYRAFHAGVADPLALSGMAGADLTIRGWPPRVERGSLATEGATLSGASLPVRFHLSHADVRFSPEKISIPAATLATPDGSQILRVQGSSNRIVPPRSDWTLDGKSRDLQALLAAASSLGYSLPPGWSLDGPAKFHLEWKGAAYPAVRRTQGNATIDGLKIRAPFLNREITGIRSVVQLSPANLKIQVASADAFATIWSGTIERKRADVGWQFALAADSLDAAEMDRWLNPQRREGLLDRVFPFLARVPRPVPVPAWLEGKGTITLNYFKLAPFALRQVRANAGVAGRHLEFSNAQVGFYGGKLKGSIRLDLTSQPSYDIKANFSRVDLSQLVARTFSLADLFGGTASGELRVSANGLGREALLRSLSCEGEAKMSNAEYNVLDFNGSIRVRQHEAGASLFPQASAEFSCRNGRVNFSNLTLSTQHQEFAAKGYVDFQRRIDFELKSLSPGLGTNSPNTVDDAVPEFRLTGTLQSPVLSRAANRRRSP